MSLFAVSISIAKIGQLMKRGAPLITVNKIDGSTRKFCEQKPWPFLLCSADLADDTVAWCAFFCNIPFPPIFPKNASKFFDRRHHANSQKDQSSTMSLFNCQLSVQLWFWAALLKISS